MRKRFFSGFLLLLIPGLAYGQGARMDSVAQRSVQGFLAPIPGATITVCTSAGAGTPCSPLATIFLDSGLTQQAPNPFPADANGNFGWWAAPGTYTYSITATGVTGKLFTTVLPITLASNNALTGQNSFSQPITSTVATGTAPLVVASTTVVPNLNAQLHNGKTAPSGNIVGDTDAQTLTNKNLSDTTTNIVNAADATKKLNIDASSNTTGVTGTLKTAYTTNKQTFFPDAAGTLAWGTGGFTTGNMAAIGPGAVLQIIDSGFLPSGVLYNTPSASTNASITATTMANVGASGGMYRISFYADQSALGSGCSTNTTINLAVVYRDPNGTSNQAQTVGAVLTIVNNGTVGNVLTGGNAAASWVYGFRSKASNVVQYQTTYNIGTCTTGPSYTVWPILEQLQ